MKTIFFSILALFTIHLTSNAQENAAPAQPVAVEATSAEPTKEPKQEVKAPAEAAPPEKRRLKRLLAVFTIQINDQPAGTFKAQLFPDKAPKTVENFVGLAEGTKNFKETNINLGEIGSIAMRPFYDGLTFHRIAPNYVIQGGCPLGTGKGGPGFNIPDEFNRELHHDGPGVLAMANTGKKNSGGSQFYITLKDLKHLDGKYAIFGRIIEGMDVVNQIGHAKREGISEHPRDKIVMKSVKIEREYTK